MLPDPVEVLRLALLEQVDVTSITSTRIGLKLQSDQPSLRLTSAGGQVSNDEGSPLVLVEAWGRALDYDDGSASNLARAVVDVVPRLRGAYAGGWLAGAGVTGFPSSSGDKDTDRPRQLLYVRLALYPA